MIRSAVRRRRASLFGFYGTGDSIEAHKNLPALPRPYVEALLVDSVLADEVWELWDEGVITDGVAAWAWCQIHRSGVDWLLRVGD